MKRGPVTRLFQGVSYTVGKNEAGLWETAIDPDNAKIAPGPLVQGARLRCVAINETHASILYTLAQMAWDDWPEEEAEE